MTKLADSVEEAVAYRDQLFSSLDEVPDFQTLEVMRALAKDEDLRRAIDVVLVQTKRKAKEEFERYDRLADFWDKAALPMAAAIPGFFAIMISDHLVPNPVPSGATAASYLAGAIAWLICRVAAVRYGIRAKAGLALLGKVD